MKRRLEFALLVLVLATGGQLVQANAQAPAKAEQKATFASVLDRGLSQVEREVVPAAEAMPDDKFTFAPTQGDFKGVRTYALQIKHIATANYMLGAGILGEKPPVEMKDENGPSNITSKAEIVKFLKDSFAYMHKAISTINETNVLEPVKSPFGPNMTTRLGLAVSAISHPLDHYGQMVEYLRMNNIIPPASRGGQ